MQPPSRKEREKARHRLEILEAAEKVFAEKGFHGATIDEIARRAEFAVGTLYNFFSSKEELYTAVLVERAKQMLKLVTDIFSDSALDPVSAIERYIEKKAQFFTEHGPFFRLFHKEQLGGSPILTTAWREQIFSIYRESISRIESAIERGIESGRFRKLSALNITLALQGITNAFLLPCLDGPDHQDYQANVPLMKTLFFRGALASEDDCNAHK